MDDEIIEKSLNVARKTWKEWRDVFEHFGGIDSNPILNDYDKFKKFCHEYSVNRTIRKGTHKQLCDELRNSPLFAEAIRDDSGKFLDRLEVKLREKYGTQNGKRVLSILSKVAAFVRPERFVAYDQYAKKGIMKVLSLPNNSLNSYAKYLLAFDTIWSQELGNKIKELSSQDGMEIVEKEPRFQRRILDVYLMMLGHRKIEF